MPNLNIPITNSKLLNKYRNHLLKNNKNLEILFTIYLNQNCSIRELSEMNKRNCFFQLNCILKMLPRIPVLELVILKK